MTLAPGAAIERARARLAALLGISAGNLEPALGVDPQFGVTSSSKIPERWVPTTCGYCSVGCGMLLGVRGNEVVSIRGNEDHPANHGKLCPKGFSEHHTIGATGRGYHPLLRGPGGLQRASWDEALDAFEKRTRAVQAKYGAGSLGVLSTGQLVTEEYYTLGKLVQLGLGTTSYDANTTLCMATAVSGYKRSFGSDGPPGCYDDLEKAGVVVLIGANIADNHPILAYRLFKNLDRPARGKVIVVDPRVTKTASLADLFLSIRPRTDVDLLNGLAHLVIKRGWVKKDFVLGRAEGYEALESHLERFTPTVTARATGLPVEKIEEAARWIATQGPTFFAWTMGVNHSTQGTETVNAINNLALLTGNVGVEGGSPFSITGQSNAMGSRETSFTSSLPGYRKFELREDREELARIWGIDPERIPTRRGLAYPDIIQAILDDRIKALWVIATNPVVSYPDRGRLLEALGKLELLVVQDGYHPTPTSELAHIYLPAAIWGEKEGTFTSSERRVSRVAAAVRPPGEARSDFEIFLAMAERLGVRRELFPDWKTPGDAFEEWRRVSRGRLCDYSGMTHASLERQSAQWPAPESAPAGTARLYAEGRFPTESGKAQLHCVTPLPPPEVPDSEYPLLLNTGRTVEHWHTRTKTGRVSLLERCAPEAWIEINPADARKLGVRNHDRVHVRSRRGALENIRARVTSRVAEGQVFLPFHFAETNANCLTLDACDPISREPNYKQSAVRLEVAAPGRRRR